MRCYAFPYIYRDIRLKSVVFNPCILRPRVSPCYGILRPGRDLTWHGGRTTRCEKEYVRTVATTRTRTRRFVQYSSAYNAIEFETLYAILILTACKLRKYIEK